jgi:hypothetical protein
MNDEWRAEIDPQPKKRDSVEGPVEEESEATIEAIDENAHREASEDLALSPPDETPPEAPLL